MLALLLATGIIGGGETTTPSPALSLASLKQFLRYEADDTHQDDVLTLTLQAGIDWVERHSGHALTQRQFVQGASKLEGPMRLDYWPVSGAVSVAYADSAGQVQTVDGARLQQLQEEYFAFAKDNRDVLLGSWFWAGGKMGETYRHKVAAGNEHTRSLQQGLWG